VKNCMRQIPPTRSARWVMGLFDLIVDQWCDRSRREACRQLRRRARAVYVSAL
jgi:hypothetical protein